MIEVYDIGNENWENHGNAVLMPPAARVKMVAGGNYDCTLTHPIDPEGKWEHLVPGAVLRVPVPEERIENAFSGYAADIYKVSAQEAQVRESPVEPTTISYPEWSDQATYQVGDKVTTSLYWGNKNWRCAYFDANSPQAMVPPYASSWWEPIAGTTSGAAVLVTVQQGGELYFVEDVDTTWYKLSTYYGVVGYVKKSQVMFYRHLDPDEVKPRIIKNQLMRITGATVDTKNRRVDVTAQHVSYDLNGTIVQEVAIAQASPAMAIGRMMENLMVPYRGTIATNLTSEDNGTYTDTIKGKSGMYCLLDPDKGIVGTFGAELHRDNWDLFIMAKTETDRGFRLRYRKNMLGVSWARKSDSLVNRVVPVAKDEKGESLYLPEKWIDSADIADYPVIRMEVLNVSGQVGKDKGDGTGDKWTLTDLYDEMRTKAAERFTVDKVDQIVEEVTVDFEMLGDTAEHADLKKLEKVLLYDQVGAVNETIGLDVMLTVTELEWDAVREKIVSLKLSSGNEKAGRNVTGYNVQNKSIGWKKLSDDVPQEILDQVKDIIPEYADPSASRPGVPNTVSQDGYVTKGQGQANKVWGTDANGNPAWREGGGGNYIPTSEKGAAGGVATLDNGGKVPASELPSYVDDVLEYASRSAFPATGESGKIYVAIDTGKTYRWSGSAYFELSTTAVTDNNPTLAWGQQAKVGSVAGTDLHVTMPANPNTDHYDWSDITNKPATATRWPTWDEVTGKPGSFYTLPLAGNGTRGGIQVGYTQSGKNYPVQLSGEKAYVNVPWENTVYSLPLAANGTRGGVQVGYTQSGKNYPVQLSGEKMYVNVPWTDHYAWTDITDKPATATRWPAWSEVTGKPYISFNGSGNKWVKLGVFTGNAAATLWIHILTGTGYNGKPDQNCVMDIYVRESNQTSGTTPITTNFFGCTVYKYKVTTAEVRVIATAWNVAEVWVHFPNWYFQGTYIVETIYTWAHDGTNYTSAPSGTQQSIENINVTDSIKNISRSGTTFTATRLDGSTFTFTQQDNDHYAWSDITDKPATATRWPTWDEVTGKPSSFYTLPLAANGTRGGIQTGYTQSGKNYPVQLSSEKAYVNVPWENTWRGIQDNLTSTSTTDSLSAKQGKNLKDTLEKLVFDGTNATVINSAINFNNYTDRGTFVIPSSNTAAGCTNRPVNVAGRFVVSNILGNSEKITGATWLYGLQIYTTYDGHVYTRASATDTGTTPTFGNWQTFLKSDNYTSYCAGRDAITGISRSGTTFTATRANGNTFTFTQQDSDTITNVNGTAHNLYVKNGTFDMSPNVEKSVSFATAFPTDCVGVVIHATGSFAGATTISLNSKSRTGFKAYLHSANGLGGSFVWTAFGY